MENSEFDKYIKTHTEKELDVPAGLSWEEMDIPLPEQKKKRRGFFWIWFGLVGFVMAGAIFMFLQPEQEQVISKNIVEENVVALEEAPTTITEIENILTQTTPEINEVTKEHKSSLKQNDSVVNSSSSIVQNNIASIKVSNPVFTIVEKRLDSKVELESSSDKILKKFKPIVQLSLKETTRTIFSIKSIDGIEIGLLDKNRTLPQLDWVNILNNEDIDKDDEDDNKKSFSMFVNFGVNQAWSNYQNGNQLEALTAAEDLAFGNSFQLGVKFPLKNKFFVMTGLTYQKLHTIFSYKEDLGTEVSLALNQRITRVKNIYHNNYFEFIELNLGVGKEFYFGKNWGSQLSLSFNPSYQLKATGRTLNEDLSVFEMENYKTVDRLLWSAGGGLDLFFNLKSNRILAGVDLKQSLSKIQLLDNSDLQLQSQVLTFKLGLERVF